MSETTVENERILTALGFVRGKGFDGDVWTNPNPDWMTQVWIVFSGEEVPFRGFSARKGFDLETFFGWWETQSREEHEETEAYSAREEL